MLFENLVEGLPSVVSYFHAGQLSIPHLAVAFDAKDAPLDLRSWQVGEHVPNVSTDIRLCRERVERITV